ncbi:hypothetical protein Q3G72_034413 [Acer saccharum]|nr:hypothetical protein Q3G72_034413 [Acer saccharum]
MSPSAAPAFNFVSFRLRLLLLPLGPIQAFMSFQIFLPRRRRRSESSPFVRVVSVTSLRRIAARPPSLTKRASPPSSCSLSFRLLPATRKLLIRLGANMPARAERMARRSDFDW